MPSLIIVSAPDKLTAQVIVDEVVAIAVNTIKSVNTEICSLPTANDSAHRTLGNFLPPLRLIPGAIDQSNSLSKIVQRFHRGFFFLLWTRQGDRMCEQSHTGLRGRELGW